MMNTTCGGQFPLNLQSRLLNSFFNGHYFLLMLGVIHLLMDLLAGTNISKHDACRLRESCLDYLVKEVKVNLFLIILYA